MEEYLLTNKPLRYVTNYERNSVFYPSGVGKLSNGLSCCKGYGGARSVHLYRVILLCGPIWQVKLCCC